MTTIVATKMAFPHTLRCNCELCPDIKTTFISIQLIQQTFPAILL